MKVDFKTHLLITPENKYLARLIINGEFYCKTAAFDEKRNAIDAINKDIQRYNFEHKTKIPLMTISHKVMSLSLSVNEAKSKAKPKASAPVKPEEKPEPKPKPEIKPKATTKPRNKPFTPYGLNGYLVDNKGHIRLMLDRRANAKTIVLTPDMFNALADMVRKTQEQTHER